MHFLFILIWILIIQISHSYGKLTISNGNDTMTVSTLDYFNYRQPYYSRRGIGILWPWANRTTTTTTNTTTNTTTAAGQDCTLMTVNLKRPIIVNTAKRAANYPDTALFFYREPALQAGCQTVAQVGRAAQKLSEQLESVGFPAITLLIFMVLINNTVPAWGPDARMYTSRNSPNIPDGPPAIDTMFLEQTSSYAFYSSAITKEFGIYFEAEEEPGPWNDVFLSHGFIAYSWILFALILLALLYLWARVIKFIQLKTLPRDLRLTIFIITSINAILVLVCLKIDTDRYQGYIVQNTAIVISALLFDLLLIHWSIRGRVAFSRWSIFCFRAIILLDIVFLLASFGVGIFIFNIGGSLDYDWLIEGLYQYFLFPLPVFAILVYGGFATWFYRSAYRVRNHEEAKNKFIMLAVFSMVASFTFVVAVVENYIIGFQSIRHEDIGIDGVAALHIVTSCKLCVRTLICLTILGVDWPRKIKKRGTRVSFSAFTNDGRVVSGGTVQWHVRLRDWVTTTTAAAAAGFSRQQTTTMNTYAASRAVFLPRKRGSKYQPQSETSDTRVRNENSTIDSCLVDPAGPPQPIHSSTTYDAIPPAVSQHSLTITSNSTSIITESNVTTTDISSSSSWITNSNTGSNRSEKSYRNNYNH